MNLCSGRGGKRVWRGGSNEGWRGGGGGGGGAEGEGGGGDRVQLGPVCLSPFRNIASTLE